MSTEAPFPSFTKLWHNTSYSAISPSKPELSAKGKNIIITGGGSGIGARTVRSFAEAGASNIGILGRREKNLLETKNSVEKDFPNTKIHALAADITKKSEVDKVFSKYVALVGQLHVLLNVAGHLNMDPPITEVDPDEWMRSVEVNVKGTLIVTIAFARSAVPDPVVVNVTSFIGYTPMGQYSSYGVSKAAGVVLFDNLQFQNPEMRVVNLHPGIVKTAMNEKTGSPGMDDPSLPGDFMVWLASPEAAFTKGRYLFANWDAEELKERAEEITGSGLLKMNLEGVPFMKA